ncbi:MAG: response regulator, partial [Deltaproteobacteria bacterium]|nr:response regulator [Deltaproteobacteria bacterium]
LTSAGEQGESARCRELGVAGYLMKPVAASDLRRVIETVVKQLAPDALGAAEAPAPPVDAAAAAEVPANVGPTADAAPAPEGGAPAPADPAVFACPRRRFLLAEDNPVNRTIGSRMLAKHGHEVVCAENGQLAVEISIHERFDVILMDVEMPIMNGFEATAAIRERERASGARRIPIIALTAHVMQGDRERCLAADMDDYATKPIQPTELFATVEALLDANPPEAPMTATTTSDAPVLDRTALYEQVGDEADLLLKVIEMFRTDSVQVLRRLDAALAARDASEVQQAAHRVKGALLTLGAKAAGSVAMQLEHMGRDGDVSGGAPLLVQLRVELGRLDPELDAVVNGLEIRTAANL